MAGGRQRAGATAIEREAYEAIRSSTVASVELDAVNRFISTGDVPSDRESGPASRSVRKETFRVLSEAVGGSKAASPRTKATGRRSDRGVFI